MTFVWTYSIQLVAENLDTQRNRHAFSIVADSGGSLAVLAMHVDDQRRYRVSLHHPRHAALA